MGATPPAAALRSGARRWIVGLLATAALACSSPVELAGTFPSPLAVGREVLAAVRARDLGRLRALAIDEREFRELVWPHLPASRPERNLSFGYVWQELAAKSEAHLRTLVHDFQDRPGLQVVDARFAGESSEYGTVKVHRATVLVLRDEAGRQLEVRLFGSTIEQDGRFKVFSYVVD